MSLEITQDEVVALYLPLLDRMRALIERALCDARINAADLDEVLLADGTTRMPLVRRLVARLFGRFPSMQLNSYGFVAQGAAI